MKQVRHVTLIALFVVLTTANIATQEAQTGKDYVIDAGGYSWLTYNFDEVTRIAGRFRARGGSGNDVEVFILDEDGFENWRNGHRAGTYYNSGRATVGRFDVTLRPGNYYLVMNNRFSSVSNKIVNLAFN